MSKQRYFVVDPLEYRTHEFTSKKATLDFLNGHDFEGNPSDEVTVFKGTPLSISRKVTWELDE